MRKYISTAVLEKFAGTRPDCPSPSTSTQRTGLGVQGKGISTKLQRLFFSGLMFTFLVSGSIAHAAPIFPVVTPGDTYQLVFVTSTFTDATSSDIVDYNAFVQAAADAALIGEGSILLGVDAPNISWTAIGSTATVNARDNALVVGQVFNLAAEVVATSFLDMWDGGLLAPINYDENGASSGGLVWSGSNSFGNALTAGSPNLHSLMIPGFDDAFEIEDAFLGSGSGTVRYGGSCSVAGCFGSGEPRWLSSDNGQTNSSQDNTFGPPERRIYALSEVLDYTGTPISAVPEPSTALLLGIGLTGLAAKGRRRNRS